MVRAHLIPYLIHQKQALRRRYAEVIEKKKLVTSTTVRLDTQIKNQQTEFVFLAKKIKTWHAYLSSEHEAKTLEYEQLRKSLNEKRVRQSEHLTTTKLAQASMQGAFQEAYQELETAYADDAGKKLMMDFVNKLKLK